METTFHMIKSKFIDHLRSKDKTAQINELLLKVLCHNICVVIQEMFELGINPQFNSSGAGQFDPQFCLKGGNDVKKVGQN